MQDKLAEINLAKCEFRHGSWEDSEAQCQARRKVLKLLMPTPPQGLLILDAGCGPGTYGMILAQHGNEVIGVDMSSDAVRVARDRANEQNVRFVPIVGDLERLPFKNRSFDMCFCGYTLHHFPDISTTVTELARVLKTGGKVVLAEPNGSNPAVILSSIVENLLRGWLDRLALDTLNEVNHKTGVYTRALERQGFIHVKVSSCFSGGLPPLPNNSRKGNLNFLGLLAIRMLTRLRRLIFAIQLKVLPQPLNGSDLLITGTKARSETASSFEVSRLDETAQT